MNPVAPTAVVKRERHGDILLITIDNPSVNALGVDVRCGLLAAIEAADAEPAVALVLLAGAGRAFIGGADIREFGKPPLPPALPDVCNRIEACAKPVIAVIHGPALGGGLEVALAAHYRIALPEAKFGLPEVQLGLLPGAGGTQRAPRLIGAAAALEMMLSGRHVGASDAHALGLVDRLGDGADPVQAGLAYARELLAAGGRVRRTRDAGGLANHEEARAAIGQARADAAKKSRGLFSPLKIVDAVQGALELPFEQGLALERKLFRECLDSPQRAGLVHVFFAERDAASPPRPRPPVHARSGASGWSAVGRWARGSRYRCSTPDCR